MYPRIATSSKLSTLNYDVDKKVDESIQNFLIKLSQIGPELLSVRVMCLISAYCVSYTSKDSIVINLCAWIPYNFGTNL